MSISSLCATTKAFTMTAMWHPAGSPSDFATARRVLSGYLNEAVVPALVALGRDDGPSRMSSKQNVVHWLTEQGELASPSSWSSSKPAEGHLEAALIVLKNSTPEKATNTYVDQRTAQIDGLVDIVQSLHDSTLAFLDALEPPNAQPATPPPTSLPPIIITGMTPKVPAAHVLGPRFSTFPACKFMELCRRSECAFRHCSPAYSPSSGPRPEPAHDVCFAERTNPSEAFACADPSARVRYKRRTIDAPAQPVSPPIARPRTSTSSRPSVAAKPTPR
jgi:hypothetical protein